MIYHKIIFLIFLFFFQCNLWLNVLLIIGGWIIVKIGELLSEVVIVPPICSDIMLNVPDYRVVVDETHWQSLLWEFVPKEDFTAQFNFNQQYFFLQLYSFQYSPNEKLPFNYPHRAHYFELLIYYFPRFSLEFILDKLLIALLTNWHLLVIHHQVFE